MQTVARVRDIPRRSCVLRFPAELAGNAGSLVGSRLVYVVHAISGLFEVLSEFSEFLGDRVPRRGAGQPEAQ